MQKKRISYQPCKEMRTEVSRVSGEKENALSNNAKRWLPPFLKTDYLYDLPYCQNDK